MGSGNCHGNRTNLWIGWEVITTEGGNCSKELASKVTGLAKKCTEHLPLCVGEESGYMYMRNSVIPLTSWE